MFRYETHLHTSPVSRCAKATVREALEFYKAIGYDGVFITNHFLDGNINIEREKPYEERLAFYFSDAEEGERLADEIGIKVFTGIEMSYGGTDFLVYGLNKDWFFAHPEIEAMKKSAELTLLKEAGALVIQAHPFREAAYIDHIRLFPRHVEGVEVVNACRTDFENRMAGLYCENYGLAPFAGSDNHVAAALPILAGMQCETPVESVADFIGKFRSGLLSPFTVKNPLIP